MANTIRHKRGTTRPTASDISTGELAINTAEGKIFTENDSGHIFEAGELLGAFSSSTITYTVTVASKTSAHRYNGTGSSNGYKINGVFSPFLNLAQGNTYKFDQADSSNSGHPFRFYLEADKSTAYTTNVTTSGTPGSAGAYTLIVITDTTPLVLHYQCSAHGYMGNSVLTNSKTVNYNDLQNQPSLFDGNYNSLSNRPTIPTATSQLTNDSGFITSAGSTDVVSDTTPQLGGDLASNGSDIKFADDDKAIFGTGEDLQIYHDGTYNRIAANAQIFLQNKAANETYIAAYENGQVELYHNNNKKFETASYGCLVTGNLGFTDNDKAVFGIGSDLQIYHTGSHSEIADSGTGDLRILTSKLKVLNNPAAADELMIQATENGSVDLYHNGSVKFQTTSSGVDVTGNIAVSGTVDGRDLATDGSKLDGIAANATNVTNNNQLTNGAGYITSAALAGASDGGNAALLDGIDSTQFLRADQDDTTTGILNFTSNSQYPVNINGNHDGKIVLQGSSNPYIRWRESSSDKAFIQWNASGYLELYNEETSRSLRIKSGESGLIYNVGGTERTVWHSGNDGSGSGLDADTLDGMQPSVSASISTIVARHSSGYIFSNYINTTDNSVTSSVSGIICKAGDDYHRTATAAAVRSFLNVADGATAGGSMTPSEILTAIKTVDGAGSGLDADTLDGVTSSNFMGKTGSYWNANTWLQFSSSHGLYWPNNYAYHVFLSSQYLKLQNNSSSNGILFQASGANRGYVYVNNSNQIGFLDQGGNWSLKTDRSGSTCTLADQHFISDTNASYDLGSSSARWRNVYTSDLDLSNEAKGGNDVDGTWGAYTIQEGEESLFLINRRNGKKYKFNLTEVS